MVITNRAITVDQPTRGVRGRSPCQVKGPLFKVRLGQVRFGLEWIRLGLGQVWVRFGQVWVRFGLGLGQVRFGLGLGLGQVWVRLAQGEVRLGQVWVRYSQVCLLLDKIVTLFITIKKVSTKIHQKCPRKFTKKCPRKFTQKEDFSQTKCPREFTYFVRENSPFMSTRSLSPSLIPLHKRSYLPSYCHAIARQKEKYMFQA